MKSLLSQGLNPAVDFNTLNLDFENDIFSDINYLAVPATRMTAADKFYASLQTAFSKKGMAFRWQQLQYLAMRQVQERLVYAFDRGARHSLSADLRGGKGFGLAKLSRLGMPVPPGATIVTSVAQIYSDSGALPHTLAIQLVEEINRLERRTGLRFGSNERPLLVSVRSGAPVSMPGMMDTVLNVGLNRASLAGLALRADERFAWDSYRRFLAMFGSTVLGVNRLLFEEIMTATRKKADVESDSALSVDQLVSVCDNFEKTIKRYCGFSVPQDPLEQLALSIIAVLDSWHSERARIYRQQEEIPSDLGTAVNIQAMVFGNKGGDSGTGVVFSANPLTGEDGLFGEYLANAQGEDVVAGVRTPLPVSAMADVMPAIYQQLRSHVSTLEQEYRDMVDVEFTVEDGQLYLLQVRSAKRSLNASAVYAVNQVEKGFWIPEEAMASVGDPDQLEAGELYLDPLALAQLAPDQTIKGEAASHGAASGKLVFSLEKAIASSRAGEKIILARMDTCPSDLPAMLAARGIITACGGSSSHAAIVARTMHLPAVVGCGFNINGNQLTCKQLILNEGDIVTIDGKSGICAVGYQPVVADQNSLVSEKIREYFRHSDIRLECRKIDMSVASERWCMNLLLNDFYLLNNMLNAAASSPLSQAIKAQQKLVETKMADIFTTYLTIAVYSELPFLKKKARETDAAAIELAKLGELCDTHSDNYKLAKALAERDCSHQDKFFRLAAQVFLHKSWTSSYGGQKWALIATAPAEYLAGQLPASVYIDHAFDLQHNGGVLFNKHDMVSSKTDETKLHRQLDIKKTVTEISNLYRELTAVYAGVSPEVQDLYDQGAACGLWAARACENKIGSTEVL